MTVTKTSSSTPDIRVPVISVEDQIKNILAMSGGIFQSVKAFKAVYAILQSRAPDIFPLEWNVLFFSIYSTKLHSELFSLIVKWGEIKEVLWRSKDTVEPFHHIYILNKSAKQTIEKPLYKDDKLPFYSDCIIWSLLKSRFAVHWAYLLELYTYNSGSISKDVKEKTFVPSLDNPHDLVLGKDEKKRERLKKLLHCLVDDLKTDYEPLTIKELPYAENNNFYIFLPFKLDERVREKFIDFYKNGVHNKYVIIKKVTKTIKDKTLKLQMELEVDSEGIEHIYDYLKLSEKEIKDEQELLKDKNFDKFVNGYISNLLHQELPALSETNSCAYGHIVDAIESKKDFLNQISSGLKKDVLEKADWYVSKLREYYELAHWRHQHIITMLKKLAKVSQKAPINMYLEGDKERAFLNNAIVEGQTMVGLEFSEDFRNEYANEFRSGDRQCEMPCGALHHIYHFVQPGEVLKAIYNNKENCLLKGGPIIGEY